MLTTYGIPALRGLHKATFRVWCEIGRFEDYLYRWREVLGDVVPKCPCGDCE